MQWQQVADRSTLVAQKSRLTSRLRGISNDAHDGSADAQLNDQLEKSKIINPSGRTVVWWSMRKQSEMTVRRASTLQIADLSQYNLRVYISGNQLHKLKLVRK